MRFLGWYLFARRRRRLKESSSLSDSSEDVVWVESESCKSYTCRSLPDLYFELEDVEDFLSLVRPMHPTMAHIFLLDFQY